MNYTTIINEISNLIKTHANLGENHFYFGEPYNLSILNCKMPYVILQPIPFKITEQSKFVKFRMLVMDIVDEDLKNYQDVLNDTENIINDIINKLRYSPIGEHFVNLNTTLNPFNEKFDNFVAGFWIDLEFDVYRNNDVCNYPDFSIPPTPEDPFSEWFGSGYTSGYTNGLNLGYTSGYTDGYLSGYSYDPISGWVRNPEWLPIPSISGSEQVAYVLVRVDSGETKMNRYACQVNSSGPITILWGNGASTTGTSGAFVYDFDFNDPNLSGLTSEGYKQALVKITSTGQITSIIPAFQSSLIVNNIKMMDYVNRLPNLTTLSNAFVSATYVPYLERAVYLYEYNNISLNQAFINAYNLKYLSIKVNNPTAITGAFQNIFTITNLDNVIVNIPSGTSLSISSTFNGLFSLKRVPNWIYNVKPTNMAGTFQNCNCIEEVEYFDTSNCVSFNTTFNGCYNLKKIANYDYSKSTSFNLTFNSCQRLRQFGDNDYLTWNLDALQSLNSMVYTFNGCYVIQNVKITTGVSFGYSSVPNQGQYLFNNCFNLKTITLNGNKDLSGLKFTNIDHIFYQCNSLDEVYIDLSGCSNITLMFVGSNYNLRKCRLLNMNSGITGLNGALRLEKSSLTRQEIVALFNDLPVVSGTYTITITNSLGAPDLTAADRLIATSKGWTITG